jgi:hypothetical protein
MRAPYIRSSQACGTDRFLRSCWRMCGISQSDRTSLEASELTNERVSDPQGARATTRLPKAGFSRKGGGNLTTLEAFAGRVGGGESHMIVSHQSCSFPVRTS